MWVHLSGIACDSRGGARWEGANAGLSFPALHLEVGLSSDKVPKENPFT